jgi:hypothetical protein
MKQVIQLEKDDDLASLRTRFETSDFSHVVLVVARGYPYLNNDPSLQLLRRAAQDAGVEVALVTRDEDVVERARDFGIPTFGTVGQARRDNWRMKTQAHALLAPLLTYEAGAPERVGLSRPRSLTTLSVENLREWRLPLALIALITIVFFTAIVLFVPAANVRLVPASLPLTLATDLTIDPTISQVSSAARTIPARRITQSVVASASLRTSTTRNLPDARSSGTVIFTNRREEESVIPPNTVVKTSAGVPIKFTTVTTTTLPAGSNSRVEAAIQAVDPGPSGNVKELAINVLEGSLSLEATVINLKPMVSGTVKPVRIVTAADKTNLDAQLTAQLKKQAADALKPELKGKEYILPDSIVLDVGDKTFDRTVDEPVDVLNLKINTDAYALAVDPDDLELLIRVLLEKQMQAGYQMLPGGIKVDSLTNGKYQPNSSVLKASLRATGNATPQVDAAKVSRALQGKSADEAATYLKSQIQLAQPPTISISPPLWNRMPFFGFRIAVFIDQGGK